MTSTRASASLAAAAGGCALAFLLIIGLAALSLLSGPVLETVVASYAWGWFVQPAFGVAMPFWTLFALNVILTLFVYPTDVSLTLHDDKETLKKGKEVAVKKVTSRAVMIIGLWAILYIVHLFVTVSPVVR